MLTLLQLYFIVGFVTGVMLAVGIFLLIKVITWRPPRF